jgi:DNA-binding transcriptional ArsR family regulator
MNVAEVVAEPVRRRLLDLLRQGEQPVGAIATRLGLSQPSVSTHLRVLREAGLVVARVDGPRRYYRLDATPLRELDDWLAPYRRFWDVRLDALQSHLAAHPAGPPPSAGARRHERK